jgi:hypothetical protein
MSYVVTMTIRFYLFDCDQDGCKETCEVRALNLDRARDKLHEADWKSSFSKALNYCPAHAESAS